MKLQPPHFANTLLFRISAAFLLLMGVCLGGYYFWIERTVFEPFGDADEREWYEDLAETELDSLAARLGRAGGDRVLSDGMVTEYGRQIRRFKAEVIVFGPDGRHLRSSAPDSLVEAVPAVEVSLLQDMSDGEWDYSSYPEPNLADAYVNRIFEVDRIMAADGERVAGYLVASFFPITVVSEDLNADARLIDAQRNIFKAMIVMLIYSAVTALLIMFWTGRRIQRLSAGVDVFAAGDLSHRVATRSTDEIGTLGRNFNSMAERIELMVDKLRQKEQFQRQLIANVSHDLRTPMASMRGYLETMLMEAEGLDPVSRGRYLKIITGNLDHLDRLVEHMLVLSRFDSGQATFRLENFPIAELADSILLRCGGLAGEKEVRLEVTAAADVGLVHADPLQIGQVLQNLVENGIKFNRPGGRVTIALAREGDRTLVEVRDTGRGIPPADLPHIFDRFYTGDESRTRAATDPDQPSHAQHLAQSSGLGLAIAAKIVAGHDSVLEVESRVGAGTVFRFRLEHVADTGQESAAES